MESQAVFQTFANLMSAEAVDRAKSRSRDGEIQVVFTTSRQASGDTNARPESERGGVGAVHFDKDARDCSVYS